MKRFNFNNKPIVESPYPPQDTNVLWVDVDESTGKVSSISKFNNGTWKVILLKLTGDMYKIYVVRKKDISNCTYNMVDLGLPSGLKWADRNVGATSPEDYGSYFQWGDTNAYTFDGVGEVTAAEMASLLQPMVGDAMEVTKDNVGDVLLMLFNGYDVGTDLTNTPMGSIEFSLDKLFNWASYFDTTDGGSTFNKYNSNDGLTVLESIDDAATVHIGPQYRMPTRDDYLELLDNTIQTFIDVDGNEYDRQYTYDNKPIMSGKLKGVRFTGSNGNSIFIPAAGYFFESSALLGADSRLWSSINVFSNYVDLANYFGFMYDGSVTISGFVRYHGLSVRGVQS